MLPKLQLETLITSDWKNVLQTEFNEPYFRLLTNFLQNEYLSKKIYPARENIFRAFNLTPFTNVKVVIIGQDPYHGHGQANGLSFSVNQSVRIPPSLQNIIKELKDDVHISEPMHGDLENWAKQGVLLLNDTLTVRKSEANSHKDIGWEKFTDAAIKLLNNKKEQLVFLIWGKKAEKKVRFIDQERHFVLISNHPSPFSAYKGFFGNRHFSKTNEYLTSIGKEPINWEII